LAEGGIDGDGDGPAEELCRTDAEHAVGRDPQLAGVDGEQGRAQGILVGDTRDPAEEIADDIGALGTEKLQAGIALPLVVQILPQIGEVVVLDGEKSGARVIAIINPAPPTPSTTFDLIIASPRAFVTAMPSPVSPISRLAVTKAWLIGPLSNPGASVMPVTALPRAAAPTISLSVMRRPLGSRHDAVAVTCRTLLAIVTLAAGKAPPVAVMPVWPQRRSRFPVRPSSP
jgi:hypothetical protein